jgi:cobalamin biosynthesis protein CobC
MPDADALYPETPKLLRHGGDLARLAAAPGAFAGRWLDLSTGINPWPYPLPPLPEWLWRSLPDRPLETRLAAAAADYYGAPGADCVVAGPGSQALIQWLPRLRPKSRVAVLGPTYEEHERLWAQAGHEVTRVTSADALEDEWDVAILANPNNPDGRRLDRAWLSTLAGRLAGRGGWLVIDEAFADLEPGLSLAAECDRPGLIILRSFGKFFGLAGLRLGFALAAPSLVARLEAALGPWAVSGPAAAIACQALADRGWIAATQAKLARAAERLDAILVEGGLRILGGTALYRLAERDDARDIAAALNRHGIHVRQFEAEPRWLRFGHPSDAAARERLGRALAAARSSEPPLSMPHE